MNTVLKPRISIDNKGRKVYTISLDRLHLLALLFIMPVLLIFGLPFYLLWNENVLTALRFRSLSFFVLFIISGVVIHELLHGLVWALFAKQGFRSIRFGIKWEYLTPYCHCTEPLRVWQFVAGALAPVLIMGLFPAILALAIGNTLLMFFGIFYIWTAAGDIIAIWIVRKFERNQLIYDHPDELGFIVMDEKSDGENTVA
jgi:hypothetical protein